MLHRAECLNVGAKGRDLTTTEPAMFATFFYELKSAKVPVTLKEYLILMEALQADLADRSVENFYYLSRAALVKDERHLDKFDQVFGHVFKGLDLMSAAVEAGRQARLASCRALIVENAYTLSILGQVAVGKSKPVPPASHALVRPGTRSGCLECPSDRSQ